MRAQASGPYDAPVPIPVLSPAAAPAIAAAARARALLALDFDGTLAPIVADRREARMRDATRALLRAAAVLYPCAVVSGRARADVAARVADAPLLAVVGSHGAEPGPGGPEAFQFLGVPKIVKATGQPAPRIELPPPGQVLDTEKYKRLAAEHQVLLFTCRREYGTWADHTVELAGVTGG